MEVQIEETGALTRVVTITVPQNTYEAQINDGLRKMQQRHRQRGFRPGKVPMSVIKGQFGRAIEQEVVNQLINDSLPKALEPFPEVVHVAQPEIVALNKDGVGLCFRCEIERLPELQPANYIGMTGELPVVLPAEDEVDQKLNEVRARHAVNQPIEGRQQIQDGDVAQIRYAVVINDDQRGHEEEVEVEVGAHNFHPTLEGALVGMSVGEQKLVTIPRDKGEFLVEVNALALFEKVLPAADDELARDDGRAETLDGLKEILRQELADAYAARCENEVRAALTDQLIEVNPFDLPARFFEQQLVEEARRRLQPLFQSGLDPKMLDPRMITEGIRPGYEKMMRRSLLLEAIADKEQVEVSNDEVNQHIQTQIADTRRKQQLQKDARAREGLRQELRMEKAYKLLRDAAQLTPVTRDAAWLDRREAAAELGDSSLGEENADKVVTEEAPAAAE
jgi:trigger factor